MPSSRDHMVRQQMAIPTFLNFAGDPYIRLAVSAIGQHHMLLHAVMIWQVLLTRNQDVPLLSLPLLTVLTPKILHLGVAAYESQRLLGGCQFDAVSLQEGQLSDSRTAVT